MDEPQPVKVVLLGESGVGKTSIINQFIAKNLILDVRHQSVLNLFQK